VCVLELLSKCLTFKLCVQPLTKWCDCQEEVKYTIVLLITNKNPRLVFFLCGNQTQWSNTRGGDDDDDDDDDDEFEKVK